MTIFSVLGILLGVIILLNIMIFVHELGHFWAARWRGLQVDRFQVWFGKPLVSKTVNGVQYGLGWLPLGGFVALPQMAPMESIEGRTQDDSQPLPPISPVDKIIVAFAGPLFSFFLAVVCAFGVWKFGKPADRMVGTEVGYVQAGSPAEKAGLQQGDRILQVNGVPVTQFRGDLDSIAEQIMLSETSTISFLINRPGEVEPMTIVSSYHIQDTKWYQRKELPQVGIAGVGTLMISSVQQHSPADLAGLKTGDRILKVNDQKIVQEDRFQEYVTAAGEGEIKMLIQRGEGLGHTKEQSEELTVRVAPKSPEEPAGMKPLLGISYGYAPYIDRTTIYPSPWEQIKESATAMWRTIKVVAAKNSQVGVQHLSGPVGIVKMMYLFAESEQPVSRLLSFFVLLNVNLAILNLLPLPVLDGGHITMALYEQVRKRPLNPQFLEPVMSACAILLLGFMVFVSFKDIGDSVPSEQRRAGQTKIVWPQPEKG